MPHVLSVPTFGVSTEEVEVIEWLKHVGEQIERGDSLLRVETDKATVDIEATHAGVLLRRRCSVGDMLAQGDGYAEIADDAEEVATRDQEVAASGSTPLEHNEQADRVPAMADRALRATPRARALARQHSVDLGRVQGSGPGGRIRDGDVAELITQSIGSPGTFGPMSSALRSGDAPATGTMNLHLEASVGLASALRLVSDLNSSALNPLFALVDLLVRAAARAMAEVDGVAYRPPVDGTQTHSGDDVAVTVSDGSGSSQVVIHNAAACPFIALRDQRVDRDGDSGDRPAVGLDEPSLALLDLGDSRADVVYPVLEPGVAIGLGVGRIHGAAGAERLRMALVTDSGAVPTALAARYLSVVVDHLEHPGRLLL